MIKNLIQNNVSIKKKDGQLIIKYSSNRIKTIVKCIHKPTFLQRLQRSSDLLLPQVQQTSFNVLEALNPFSKLIRQTRDVGPLPLSNLFI